MTHRSARLLERYVLDHDLYEGTETRAAMWTDYEACASWCERHGIPPLKVRVIPAGLPHCLDGPWRFNGTHFVQEAAS